MQTVFAQIGALIVKLGLFAGPLFGVAKAQSQLGLQGSTVCDLASTFETYHCPMSYIGYATLF
jgi:hypothetical protein